MDLDDKVKRINGGESSSSHIRACSVAPLKSCGLVAGTDPEYKRRLIEIENDHKRAQAVLDARKEVQVVGRQCEFAYCAAVSLDRFVFLQLACFDQLCQGEAYAAELTLAIDKERCKFLLIRKLTHPTPPETPDVDMPSEGDAEESEFYMEPFRPLSPSPATDPPALLEAQGAMTEDEEPLAPTGLVPLSRPQRTPLILLPSTTGWKSRCHLSPYTACLRWLRRRAQESDRRLPCGRITAQNPWYTCWPNVTLTRT